jgi:hypothetical protein
MAETFTSKLGNTSKAGERTRVWLEGARLVNAGFTVGTRFARIWSPGKLTLRVVNEKDWQELARDAKGTVSGKGDKPIIDIVGAKVREAFGKGETVSVTYHHERITITA